MQHEREWGPLFLRVVVASLEPAIWTGEHHLWHESDYFPSSGPGTAVG